MATIKCKLTGELRTKLLRAKDLKRSVRENLDKVLQYLEEEESEIEKRELELRNETIIHNFTENLLAERDQKLLDKESIIAKKDESISELEAKLANAEVKLSRKSLLISEQKQAIKKKDLRIQQLETSIEKATELHLTQLTQKNT